MSESTVSKEYIESDKKKISFSQFSDYQKCPRCWKLGYMDKRKKYESSIHTCFGTAIHEACQTFLEVYFNEGSIKADEIDAIKIFKDVFAKELRGEKEIAVKDDDGNYVLDDNGEKTYTTEINPVEVSEDDLEMFIEHGVEIIKVVIAYDTRTKYFNRKKYRLVGMEIPVDIDVMYNLLFVGYLDIVIQEIATGKIKIIDLKTSGRMWNKYQQNDVSKQYQLLLYKAFYSKKMGLPLNKIEVEFLVLKRTLLENVSFPESRLQKVACPSGQVMVNESVTKLVEFIKAGFTPDGTYNYEGQFIKTPHKGKVKYSNCRFCEFADTNGGDCNRKEGF